MINLKTEKVDYRELVSYEYNGGGFPIINPTMQGKKHCYTYLTEL